MKLYNTCTSGVIKPGKINMIIDGQFGSTGKGLIASKLALDNFIHIACGTLSPNAGHTFYYDNKKYITKLLPVAGVIHDRSLIYLSSDSVIDENVLLEEIEKFNIDDERLIIHPRASIVSAECKLFEKDKINRISSTLSGTGYARASKIMRDNPLIINSKYLKKYINPYFKLEEMLKKEKLNVLLESGQGVDLGLNHGLSYPYCTSYDVLPSYLLGGLGLHPKYLGNVILSLRTYPIRVGNVKDEYGNEIGYSGPCYPDSKELSFEDLNQIKEYTTVTGKVRRIFTWSNTQYCHALELVKPSHVFLNFINYIRECDLNIFKFRKYRKPDFMSFGPDSDNVVPFEYDYMQNLVYGK